jgi:predicted GIY-YIG superfamily endonuclease
MVDIILHYAQKIVKFGGFDPMFIVYIIQAELNKKYYIRCSDNLERRLSEHNSGYSKYTRTERK